MQISDTSAIRARRERPCEVVEDLTCAEAYLQAYQSYRRFPSLELRQPLDLQEKNLYLLDARLVSLLSRILQPPSQEGW